MREFKKHRSKREELIRLVLRGCGVLGLAAVTVLLLHAAWDMYVKMAAASQGQEGAEVALASIKAQQQGVDGSLGELASERGKEAEIRDRFGVVRSGEGEIDIVRDAASSSSTGATPENWWQQIFRALFVW